ncbi:MAG: bile acid:sodium symporter family protein [Pirellula sp.]|jgi:BASS family bile acid:Na+ symporter|nr:bile acid:sodium symporter family protein [Pirellula sp.]
MIFEIAIFGIAVGMSLYSRTRTFGFAFWVVAFVWVAYLRPEWFSEWFGWRLKGVVPSLIQIAMFGMGATLTLEDFARVLKMPKAVAIGCGLQYSVMPLVGWGLASMAGLPPEVAAGIILVGACPGGVSSNVVTYLAKGNIALSVTMTACSTLLSPVMTPLAMKLLAGQLVEVDFWKMLWSIVTTVVLPIAGGLLVNRAIRWWGWSTDSAERMLSRLAMLAICLICAIIMADSRDALQSVGLALILVVGIHNLAGYAFGYGISRLSGLNEAECRTVAIEVGLQNGGMGATIATEVLKSTQAALASVLFAPWMNVSGSILASWWRARPTDEEKSNATPAAKASN